MSTQEFVAALDAAVAEHKAKYGHKTHRSTNDHPDQILSDGMVVRMFGVWGYGDEGMTPAFDIEIALDVALTLRDALILIEQEANERLKPFGAEIRQHFLEEVRATPFSNKVVFIVGT
ncbi:hypothetical protein [Vibrio variabilis]|uniref:hypothetical protein n=1 Tax=Vibrio variabilis TaxID=990271 RepID=UPI000DDC2A34|nr:hypothetical protein [Vibrio variabilis]